MSTLTLHGFPISTYVRTCRMAADEKGVEYTLNPNPPQSPEQIALHPWGKVPAMTHGETTLYETTAITAYIDEAFDGPALQPVDSAGRAKMYQTISVINSYLYQPAIIGIVIQRLVVPQQGGTPDAELIKTSIPKTEETLRVIDANLGGSPFLAGNTVTLADLFLLPITHYLSATAPEGETIMSANSNIERWQNDMLKRESAQIALA